MTFVVLERDFNPSLPQLCYFKRCSFLTVSLQNIIFKCDINQDLKDLHCRISVYILDKRSILFVFFFFQYYAILKLIVTLIQIKITLNDITVSILHDSNFATKIVISHKLTNFLMSSNNNPRKLSSQNWKGNWTKLLSLLRLNSNIKAIACVKTCCHGLYPQVCF